MKRRPRFGRWDVLCLAVLGVLGNPRVALAADDDEAESSEKSESSKKESSGDDEKDTQGDDKPSKDEAFGHGNQVGARLGIVGGYRMILRYDDSQPCAKIDLSKAEQQKFCGHACPSL